jgi:hypothetical protein
MLLLAPMLCALSPPTATRRALLATSATSLLWRLPANAASDISTLKAAAREERIEKAEELELLDEMRKIKLAEEMEAAQLERLRAVQKNPLARATNIESPKKLRREDLEETSQSRRTKTSSRSSERSTRRAWPNCAHRRPWSPRIRRKCFVRDPPHRSIG